MMIGVERSGGGMGKPVSGGESDQNALAQAPQTIVGPDPKVSLIIFTYRPDNFGRHAMFRAKGLNGLALHPVESPGGPEPVSAGAILVNHTYRATGQPI